MNIILAVAAGGAIGAVGRYLVMVAMSNPVGSDFPYGTLTVNIVGSFALASLLEISALAWSPSPELRAMLVVGVLGAFTTFSTFSMDAYYLYERGALGAAAAYIALSVGLGLAAFVAGLAVFRSLLG